MRDDPGRATGGRPKARGSFAGGQQPGARSVGRRGSWPISVAIASAFPAAWSLLQLLTYALLLWYGRLAA